MASSLSLETLPGEILLHILTYLDPRDIAQLQRTSKTLCRAGRDAGFWRLMAYDDSRYLRILERRRRFGAPAVAPAASTTTGPALTTTTTARATPPRITALDEAARARARKAEKTRILANWDPVFPGEAVSWYDEYVQRCGPLAVSWFEVPRRRGGGGTGDAAGDAVDVLGVALYRPDSSDASLLLAVAPLEDGSVCLWDVTGSSSTGGRSGAIVQRSAPGLLPGLGTEDGDEAGLGLGLGADDCVSVDSRRGVGYFSVWHRLVEVDLTTLTVVAVVDYPSALTALSSAHLSTPLTVGMANGIHLHDARVQRPRPTAHYGFRAVDDMVAERVDRTACGAHPAPGPLAILHLPQAGTTDVPSPDVYTAGRFPSILHYDVRNLATVQDAIHSGASLAGLASLPYAFSARDAEMRRHGTLSVAQVEASKARAGPDGRTLLACGDYKARGSLELYDLGSGKAGASSPDDEMKNRHTTSPARLVAVAAQGARIVVSDTLGYVRWFERDGFTEVRHYDLNAAAAAAQREDDKETETGVFARKLVPTQLPGTEGGAAADGMVFWTGDRLGMLSFTGRPRFRASDFVAAAQSAEERAGEREATAYRASMRQFFHDVRMAGEFGL